MSFDWFPVQEPRTNDTWKDEGKNFGSRALLCSQLVDPRVARSANDAMDDARASQVAGQ